MKRIKQYQLIELIGTGGMGKVYKGYDTFLDRYVAIKVLHPHLLDDKATEQRFIQEARAAASLVHPNIVTIYEAGKTHSGRFLAMEYVDGRSLRELQQTRKALAPDYAINLTMQILRGLAEAHRRGIMHRDIKPDNVLVTEEDVVKILDFGIAKILTRDGLTIAGDILGTVEYMAPEQMLGEATDHRQDIYATGVVLYQLLTGRMPFNGENAVAILFKILNEMPPRPSHFNLKVSRELDEIVLKAISRKQDDRWQDAREFLEALQTLHKKSLGDLSSAEPDREEPIDVYLCADAEIGHKANENFYNAFVGREKEFKRLIKLFEQASTGHGNTVIIRGEAGIGKSELAARLKKYVLRQNARVLSGKCLFQERTKAYLPFLDAINDFTYDRGDDSTGEELGEIKQLLRDTFFVFGGGGARRSKSKSGAAKEPQLFEAIYRILVLLSKSRPLVLIIDDLHWADQDSLELFQYLSHHVMNKRILLIGISRTERFDLQRDGRPSKCAHVLAITGREANCEQIDLHRLKKEDFLRLINQTCLPALFTEEFQELLFISTGGNPFFIAETLKLLRDKGCIFIRDGVWYNKDKIGEIEIPPKVEDIFVQRLNSLNSNEREILEVAAVIGPQFHHMQLMRVLKAPKIKLLKVLQRIEIELQILRSTENCIQFEPPMLSGILYNAIPPALRREYHLLIASDLNEISNGATSDVAGELAYHYRLAGRHKDAVSLLYPAAKRAFEQGAYNDACTLIEDYLDSIKHLESFESENGRFIDVYQMLGTCYEQQGKWSESLGAYQRLVEIAEKESELDGQIKALLSIGRVAIKLGKLDNAKKYSLKCLEIAQKHDISDILGLTYNNLGVIHYDKGSFEEAQRYFEKAIQSIDNEKHKNIKAHALTNIGVIASLHARYSDALKSYKKALKIYGVGENPKFQARVMHNIGLTYLEQSKWSKATEAFSECLELLKRVQDKQLHGLIYLNLGKTYAMCNKPAEARIHTERALRMFKLMGDVLNVAEAYHVFGLIYTSQGDFAKARIFLNESVKLNQQKDNLEGLASSYESLADTFYKEGATGPAKEYYDRAVKLYRNLKLDLKVRKLLGRTKQLEARSSEFSPL